MIKPGDVAEIANQSTWLYNDQHSCLYWSPYNGHPIGEGSMVYVISSYDVPCYVGIEDVCLVITFTGKLGWVLRRQLRVCAGYSYA